MQVGDFTTGGARLHTALEHLQIAWNETREVWQDVTAARFEETYLEPLPAAVKSALEAVNRLGQIVSQMQRECDDR